MQLFLTAFGLGLAFFASPGAVTAQPLRRGLEHGFFSALFLQLGALIGVTLWPLIAFIGAAFLVQYVLARVLLLAWQALRAAYHGKIDKAKATSIRGDFALGAAISLANPLPIAFWLGIGSTVLATGEKASPDPHALVIFLGGFLSSAFLWCFFLASLIAWGRRFVTPLFFRFVNLVCGLALGLFALKLLWSTILLLKG